MNKLDVLFIIKTSESKTHFKEKTATMWLICKFSNFRKIRIRIMGRSVQVRECNFPSSVPSRQCNNFQTFLALVVMFRLVARQPILKITCSIGGFRKKTMILMSFTHSTVYIYDKACLVSCFGLK